MNIDFAKITAVSKEIIAKGKSIFGALRKGNLKVLLGETVALIKLLYDRGLRGRYVTVKNVKVPLTAIVVAVLLLLYFFYPSGDDKVVRTSEEIRKETNIYENDGVKIFDLRKCNDAVCGTLENASDKPINHIVINITFHDQAGNVVYHGGVETTDVAPMTRMKMTIPSETPFAYFKLGEVEMEK